MPRNGSGAYTLPAGNPVVTQTLITSVWANTTMNDLAAAITQSLSRDGQSTPTANLPMGNFRIVGAGDPVGLQDYVNLRSLQLGQFNKLTSIAGSANDVSGNLPGGATVFQNGQTVLFTPLADNTGPMTLSVNGAPPAPVVSASGAPLPAGALQDGLTYSLIWNNGSWYVSSAQGAGTFSAGQSAISGWTRPVAGNYPLLSVASAASVGVPAGSGYVVAPSARDASAVVPVSWGAQNVVISGLATGVLTTLGVNASGVIEQVPGVPDTSWARSHVILGEAVHPKGAVVEAVTAPNIFADLGYLTWDMADLLRGFLISGGGINGNLTNPLSIGVDSAVMFGAGYTPNTINDPNKINLAADDLIEFYPVTQDNVVGNAATDVPVTNYNPAAGTILPLPTATSATIHRLYWLGGSQFLFMYGQFPYTDLQNAIENISVDGAQSSFPAVVGSAIFLGYIIAQKDCVDLKNTNTAALLFAVPSLGGSSGGGGGGIPDSPQDGWYYGRSDSEWKRVSPLAQGIAGTDRPYSYWTGTSKRWDLFATATPETGSNAGTNLALRSYDDAGAMLRDQVVFARDTGQTTFGYGVTFQGTVDHNGAVTFNSTAMFGDPVTFTDTVTFATQPTIPGYVMKSGDVMSGPLTVNNSLRTQNWGAIATDGVVYFGNDNSYLFKTGANFDFVNQEGGFTARLQSGGTIWTANNFTPGNYVLKAGDVMTGTLTAPAVYATEFRSSTGSIGYKYFVGDDAAISDIGEAHTIGVQSQSDGAQGGIKFGDGPVIRRSFGGGSYLDITGGLNVYAPGGSEGGEISLVGVGANATVILDNQLNQFRVFGGSAAPMAYGVNTGNLSVPGRIDSGNVVHGGSVTIGPDDDILLYESAPNTLGIRTGTGAGFQFWGFGADGVFGGGGNTLRNGGTGNPTLAHGSASLNLSGEYGGGIRFKDGAVTGGMWMQSDGTLRFGVNTADTGLQEKLRISPARVEASTSIQSSGDGAMVAWQDRSNLVDTATWGLYASAGRARLWHGSGGDQAWWENTNYYVAGNIFANSDRRLKSDIRPLEDGADLVNRLLPKRYVKGGREDLGFIAQDVLEVIPEAVTVPDDPEEMLSLNYAAIIPALVSAVQSLTAEVKALREQVAKLEEK